MGVQNPISTAVSVEAAARAAADLLKQDASTAATDAELAAHAADLALHSSGRELAYAETTTDVAGVTSSAYADSGLVLPSFTVGSRPVLVDLWWPNVTGATADCVTLTAITDSANNVLSDNQFYTGIAFAALPMLVRARITTPGTYAGIKARHKRVSGSGSCGWRHGSVAGAVAFLRAVEG